MQYTICSGKYLILHGNKGDMMGTKALARNVTNDFVCDSITRKEMQQRFLKHYSRQEILYEIVKYANSRELSFLGDGRVRGVMAHKVSYLLRNFKAFDFGKKLYNVYFTVAKIRNLGALSFAPPERKKQLKELTEKFNLIAYEYDLVLDFDAKEGHNKAYSQCRELKEYFDCDGIEYFLKFSGSGFHIVIPHYEVSKINPMEKFDFKKRVEFCKEFAQRCKDIFALDTLDDSIYDMRRLWKCPYTLDIKTGNVAMPLTDTEFNNFKLEMVDMCSDEYIDSVRPKSYFMRKAKEGGIIKFYKEILNGS